MERTVLVGGAQLRRKPGLDGDWDPIGPLEMMAQASEAAVADVGADPLLGDVDLVATVDPIAWSYAELPDRLASRLGIRPTETATVMPGGNSPCLLLNEVVGRIAEGRARVALLAGAEAIYSRRRAHREGASLEHWGPDHAGPRDVMRGQPLSNPLEQRHRLFLPIHLFPLIENALRARAGRAVAEHQDVLARLMSRFSSVAARNPCAWFPRALSPDEIREVTPENRWICFPYPKRMNATLDVDQAAALVCMSESEADRRGIPVDRRVHFLAGSSGTDIGCVSERPDIASSPAYRRASRRALDEAGVDVQDVDRFDLYSCFPSAVGLALDALGIGFDDPRPMTVTGGLPYAGGPGNNYSMHALVRMAELVRRGEVGVGYVSALGLIATKHAMCVLGNGERADAATGSSGPIDLPEAEGTGVPLIDAADASGSIETYTVLFDRDNRPELGVVVVRLDDGRRTLAHTESSPAVFRRLVEEEGVGAKGRILPGDPGSPNRFLL